MVTTALTLGTLSAFRWVERLIPAEFYAHFVVRFARGAAMPESDLRRLVAEHRFTTANLSYRLENDGHFIEYRMVIRTQRAFPRLGCVTVIL